MSGENRKQQNLRAIRRVRDVPCAFVLTARHTGRRRAGATDVSCTASARAITMSNAALPSLAFDTVRSNASEPDRVALQASRHRARCADAAGLGPIKSVAEYERRRANEPVMVPLIEECPSPPSQLNETVPRPASPEVDTEGFDDARTHVPVLC
jgi:hypothetical protein